MLVGATEDDEGRGDDVTVGRLVVALLLAGVLAGVLPEVLAGVLAGVLTGGPTVTGAAVMTGSAIGAAVGTGSAIGAVAVVVVAGGRCEPDSPVELQAASITAPVAIIAISALRRVLVISPRHSPLVPR